MGRSYDLTWDQWLDVVGKPGDDPMQYLTEQEATELFDTGSVTIAIGNVKYILSLKVQMEAS